MKQLINRKILLLISLLCFLPGCEDEEIIYGKIVDNEKDYYPYLTRNERIYMKLCEKQERENKYRPQIHNHHTTYCRH
jgi:hypothetical protein